MFLLSMYEVFKILGRFPKANESRSEMLAGTRQAAGSGAHTAGPRRPKRDNWNKNRGIVGQNLDPTQERGNQESETGNQKQEIGNREEIAEIGSEKTLAIDAPLLPRWDKQLPPAAKLGRDVLETRQTGKHETGNRKYPSSTH
ncbi:hypothetical protein Dda_7119 [Drechslerella dactyloides]|uniref:Uncharacterized protein n=1 Tax=Drechslerella dactyloides TaxID=74499 RepID=A0AAD6IT67_DREDA|nr:hypothetical protein Dda_7119 [Drechslerella dactyloides]